MTEQKKQPELEGEIVNALTPSPLPAKAGNNIFIGTLNFAAKPARHLARPLHRHYHRKYHGKYRHAKKLFVLDLALVAVALALLAASLYFFLAKPTPRFLNVFYQNSQPLTIGQTQNFTFLISNTNKETLQNIILHFQWPTAFVIKEAPANFDPLSQTLFLGELKGKQSKNLDFQIQPWGNLNENVKLIVRAQLSSPHTKKNQEEITSLDLPLEKSALALEWQLPETVKVGQTFSLIINYRNRSNEKIAYAILRPALPLDWETAGDALKKNQWILENLEPGQSGRLELSGFLRSQPAGNNITFALQSFVKHNDQEFAQISLLKYLTAADQKLKLRAVLTDNQNYLKTGEETKIFINYHNQNAESIKDAVFSLSAAEIETVGLSKIKKQEIKANEKGQAVFIIKLKENLITEKSIISIQPQAAFSLADGETLRVFAPALQLKIAGAAQLHAEARYFTEEGDQLGRGPLPPRVGQTTKYWINLFITAAPNALKDAIIVGRLPAGITWTSKTSATEGESAQFDPISRAVSWRAETIAPTPGQHCPCQGAGFEVAVTPAAEDAGKILTLLNQLSLQGVDEVTGEILKAAAPDITTDLIKDNLAKNKGVVKE